MHNDVWGPTQIHFLGGSRYYVTFIHDSISKVFVYFLENKSDVFVTLKKWTTEAENQKSLHVGNSSECDSHCGNQEFKEFCIAKGIRMIRIVPTRSKQNYIADRVAN